MRALLILALLIPTTATAQIAPGSSGSSTLHTYGHREAMSVLAEFGTCYASRSRTSAFELLATRPGSVEEAKVYKQLFRAQNQSCLSLTSELRVSYPMVRGAIGEGMYHKAIAVPANLAVSTAPTADNVRNFGDAALCYAGANPARIHALAQTRVGSKEELEAIEALLPTMGSCFPPNAQKMPEMSATLMRFRLTEALWKLGKTPEGAR